MKEINLILSILAIALLMPLVSAGISLSLDTPTNSGVVCGNYVINATISGQIGNETVPDAMTNCSFYAKSSSTANSSWSTLSVNAKNVSSNASNIWATFNFSTLAIEDSNDYTFNATCTSVNITRIVDTSTSVIVDCSTPTTPSSLTPLHNSLITSSGEQSFSSTVTNSKTTSCTYTIARGGAISGDDYISNTGTYSASTCSFTKTFSDTKDNGNWYWYITASDGTNTTSSSQNILQVQLAPIGGNTKALKIIKERERIKNLICIIIGIIVSSIVIYVIAKRK